jgi:hypothetical protein
MIIHEMAEEGGIPCGSCQAAVTGDLGMGRVCIVFVPRQLAQEQKENRLSVASVLLECAETGENFLKKCHNKRRKHWSG